MFQAFEVVRKEYEKLYKDTCTITTYEKIRNEDMSTELKEVVACENQPCRLSFQTKTNTNDTDSASATVQTIELFISPDIIIKAGSDITVTHEGRTTKYKNSGVPAVYPTHQEIILEYSKEWA